MKKILLIDDDEKLGKLLAEYLRNFNFEIITAQSSSSGLGKVRGQNPELILLDIMLPGKSGLELLKDIRQVSSVPILMLTARGDVADKVLGLENGADDYLAKPFEPRELAARIQSLLRRSVQQFKSVRAGELEIKTEERRVFLAGAEIETTAFEFILLKTLAQSPGKVFSRDELVAAMHGEEFSVLNRSLDVIIKRLRDKVGDDAKNPRFIKTVRGMGYAFVAR
jgi:DNA-binding response OmpR family regulator